VVSITSAGINQRKMSFRRKKMEASESKSAWPCTLNQISLRLAGSLQVKRVIIANKITSKTESTVRVD
jgi:hypothetical protein